MSLSHRVYDWPPLRIRRSLFFAGGQAFEGGFTSGGAKILTPEPGGRSFLDLDFAVQKGRDPLISWAMSKIANGNIFRVPIRCSPQVISASDLGVNVSNASDGVPWAAEGLIPAHSWDNGQNWAYEIGAVAQAAALEGTTSIVVDMGDLEPALRPGHVIGIGDTPHLVADIEWDESVATIEIDPPLRADLSSGAYITFRPTMLCVAENPESFRGLYGASSLVELGSVRFIEAIV